MEGGNNLEQAVALVAAANKVVQDPNSVGSALRTISLRLRGTSVEILEEMGEETDGVVESVSKLQEKLKALTGVDIVDMNGAYKDTYTILRQIGAVWKDLDPMDQAAALELMAGKNRANTLAAILNNMEDLSGAYESAMDANGSASRELDTYMNSIQGKIDQFNNALQTLWNNTLNSDIIKGFVDAARGALEFVDAVGVIPTALAGVLFYFTAIKKNNPVTFFKDMSANMHNYGLALKQIQSIQSLNGANGTSMMDTTTFNDQHIKAYGLAVQGLTQKQQVAALATAGLSKEQIAQAIGVRDLTDANFQAALAEAQVVDQKKQSVAISGTLLLADQQRNNISLSTIAQNWLEANSEQEITKQLLAQAVAKGQLTHKDAEAIFLSMRQTQANIQQSASWRGLATSIKQIIAQNPVMFFTMIATAVSSLISKIETATDRTEKLTEAYNELQSNISDLEGNINSLDSELSTIQDKIDELNSQDTLSLADAEQLNLLKQQSAELERQKELKESMLSARESQNQQQSLTMINNMLKTTAANQQKTAEAGKNWGKYVVGALAAIGAVAGVLAAVPTGGLSLGATTVSVGTLATGAGIAGATIGGAAGSKIGEWAGSQYNKSDSLIEWYETYEEAISEAEQKASEAESKYMSKMTEDNREKWQKKVEYVNTLQTEMYDGLTELQDYISNLEYNDNTKDVIDSYNNLMAYLDVKSNSGDIDTQISSIESLQDEYSQLSRGVDEYGNNMALTAEEYSRYQSIVAQVLGYNAGLTQTFNENGSAIYDAQGKLVGYNSVLTETIRLLKEQQKQAVVEAIEGSDGSDNPLWDAYQSAQKNQKNILKKSSDYSLMPMAFSYGDGLFSSTWGSDDAAKIIGEIIGEKSGLFDEPDTLIKEYTSKVAKNKDEIVKAISEKMEQEGISEEQISKYINDYTVWLDDAIVRYSDANSTLASQFKQTLTLVPQLSDQYDNLSGSQLSFVNEYISSLEIVNDLSKDEIVQLKDNIVSLVDAIGTDEDLQNKINDLISLDPSTIPVSAYRKQFEKLWNEIAPSIPEDQRQSFLEQLFPDQSQIDTMIENVAEKLDNKSRSLVEHLSVEELKVAYKIIPDLKDGLSFEELRAEIQERLPQAIGPIVESYSTLAEQATQLNEILAQTSEIIIDNTKVTQEYKDSLIELGVSEEELEDCFDATNGLVVKNAKKLNDLVKKTKTNTAATAALAKTQARLQYSELYQEIKQLVNGQQVTNTATLQQIVALYHEMNALEKTIARYSVFEAQLLGAANAYEKFAQAQEIDSQTDYISSAEEMVLALGQAFNTAELGTEAAQTAIAGLVPESVYKDLDTVDEKMAAIHKYFEEGKIAQYFDLEFDDDGAITGAEMKLGNLRKFIEDGLSGGVFEGADWMHFDLSEDITSLEDFAEQMGVTKEVAFAFLETLEDHDIEWLNGDYTSLLEKLLPENLETKIYNNTSALADLEIQLATGKITAEEYATKLHELNTQQGLLAEEARTEAQAWNEKTEKLAEYKKQLEEYQEQLKSGKDSNGNIVDAEEVKKQVEETTGYINTLTKELADLEEPTDVTLQLAWDDIQADMDAIEKEIGDIIEGTHYQFNVEAAKYEVILDESDPNYQKVTQFVDYLNEQHVIDTMMGSSTPDVVSTLQGINDTLANIQKLLETEYSLKVNTDGAVTNTSTFKSMWDSIQDKSVTLWANVKKSIIEFITRTPSDESGAAGANGTAHAKGTVRTGKAHKSGDWGLPKSEHNALVGELGAELVNL